MQHTSLKLTEQQILSRRRHDEVCANPTFDGGIQDAGSNREIDMRQRTGGKRTKWIERLETRTLLSGWSTVDNYQPAGGSASLFSMGADGGGNVYAVGCNSNGSSLAGIVREKAGGSSNWTTVEQTGFSGIIFHGLAADAAGDVYVAGGGGGNWLVLERPAGQSTFSTVDTFVPSGQASAWASSIAIDAAGDVFVAGSAQVTTKTGGGTTTLPYWTVREQAAGRSGFSTVDSFVGPANDGLFRPNGITVVNSGPNAGIYVTGIAGSNWMVRKGTNGGGSWSTIDSFQYKPGYNSGAEGVAADANGNVYAVGYSAPGAGATTTGCHWLVRESTNGGATWQTSDDYQLSASSPRMNEAFAAGVDAAGNAYAVGEGADSSNVWHSIVRTNAGGTWHTIDDYQLTAGYASTGHGFAVDSSGNLYEGVSPSGSSHWVVRELAVLAATIATPTFGPGGAYSTTISFNRAVTGFDLTDLTLMTPAGTVSGSDLIADGATLTTSDNINYLLTLPSALTDSSGSYQLLLTAAGAGITDGNSLPLASNALVSWTE